MWLNLRVISLTCHLHETVDAIQKLFSRSLSNAITRKWLVHLCEGLWNSSYLKRSALRRQWLLALQCFFKFLKPYPRRSRFPKVWLKTKPLGSKIDVKQTWFVYTDIIPSNSQSLRSAFSVGHYFYHYVTDRALSELFPFELQCTPITSNLRKWNASW